MDQHLKNSITALNHWQNPLDALGQIRTHYLNTLLGYLGNKLVKVLIGQRRSGKSTIMKQLLHHLVEQQDVAKEAILYLNFEWQHLHTIRTSDQLHDIITYFLNTIAPKKKTLYFLFDEIQEVEGWERVINSYLANDQLNVEIIITGSNAKLLSSELATYLTGRYISKTVFPFSFLEYCDVTKHKANKEHFLRYLQHSHAPEMLNIPSEEARHAYISALKDSILFKDIVKRFEIKNAKLLEMLFYFLTDNIGNLCSYRAITAKLKDSGMHSTVPTISDYIHYLEQAFLFYSAERYDIKGKRILEGEKKYYLNDIGFRHYFSSSFDIGLGKRLENYVFTTLKQKGYQVYVGRIKQYEIDFIAEKSDQKIYLQATYMLTDEKVIKREYGNLMMIKDNYPKYVISMDDIHYPNNEGIEHIQAWNLEKIK